MDDSCTNMSFHSRSSSEIETAHLCEILPKHLETFKKDLSFCDVKDLVKNIFTDEEMRLILGQTDEKKQILQLFWILLDNEDKIPVFLKAIEPWYSWLSKSVSNEQDTIKDTQLYVSAVRLLRSNYQKHMDLNVHRMEFYCEIRSALLKLKPYNFLLLIGELGIGKKWLFVDVCCEYTVMKIMGYHIFKLDVHNCVSREDDFRALQELLLLIGEEDSTWRSSSEFDGVGNKILHLQQHIRELFQREKYKDCLLVLCGVQNSKTWKNFNLGCKVLIITRNKHIKDSLSKQNTKCISIDRGLTETEFFQLFEKILYPSGIGLEHRTEASEICRQIGGQPYLLTIIGNHLKLNKQRNWNEWKNNVQNLRINENKFKAIVGLSLEVLRPNEKELYRMLAIFPHSFKIPLKIIAAVWNKSEREADFYLSRFDKNSIINRVYMPDETVAYVLPYIYRSYLEDAQNIDCISLHKNVVNYYMIKEALEERRDVDLLPMYNDNYFYSCIGYHLKKSGYLDLFPKLFLDFGFLGEKLRSNGFPNTIGDLKHFREEITNGDKYKNRLLSAILDFLPSTEGSLMLSKDTFLLQSALMADGLVREEAIKQAKCFPDRIWFKEQGDFHQRRQTVFLPNNPKLIKSLEPDICVIVLETKDILLFDMSLDYNNGPVYLTGNECEISQMELILNENYILTRDVKGTLRVWSLKEDRRRSACRKRSSRTKVNPLNLTQNPEMSKRKCKQLIEKRARGPIKVFYIESYNEVDLHLAFSNGDVCIYTWNAKREQFDIKSVPVLPTRVTNIIYLSKILGRYYMVLNSTGDIFFFNLADGSKTSHSFEWPKPLNLIYVGEYYRNSEAHIMFVFRDKVMRLSFPPQKYSMLFGELEVVYNMNEHDPGNAFTCARLSRDGYYLVLGTKRGLIVFNTEQKLEVLRGNISECIACVDIYPLDDNIYKYIIVCGSEHSKVLNLFALRQLENNTIAWSHHINVNGTGNADDHNGPQLEPNVWLQGNKLFDFYYSNSSSLVAVDSKNRIHQLCTTNTKTWSILLPPETSAKITAITAHKDISYCAYENGAIFNITDEVFEQSFTNKSITLLQLINGNVLVASSAQATKTLVRRTGQDKFDIEMQKTFDIDAIKCFILHERYLTLVNPRGNFMVVDLENEFELVDYIKDLSDELGGCDLKNNFLVFVTANFKLRIYKFISTCEKPTVKRICSIDLSLDFYENADDVVTCLAISNDASLFAIGCQSGQIKIYRNNGNSVRSIYCLLSHTSRIYDLKFSPSMDVLVSCSEQLCFWHVPYILNNPFDTGTQPKRRSSRFSSSHSTIEETTNAMSLASLIQNGENSLQQNPWANKRGHLEKEELLSCIKFVGSKAEIFFANQQFTEFNTIDNEGVYYHLCVHDICLSENKNGSNGNGHAVNNLIDDEVII